MINGRVNKISSFNFQGLNDELYWMDCKLQSATHITIHITNCNLQYDFECVFYRNDLLNPTSLLTDVVKHASSFFSVVCFSHIEPP